MTALLLSGPNTMAEGNVPTIVPAESLSPDLAIAPNFERFDGLGQPHLSHPATLDDTNGGTGFGSVYGWERKGFYPRPGQVDTPPAEQTYTPGVLMGVTGTIGGAPLPVRDWKYQSDGRDGYTGAIAPGIQFRQGVGQRGPSELGAAQTTALGQLTNNPPEPGSLDAIIAGLS